MKKIFTFIFAVAMMAQASSQGIIDNLKSSPWTFSLGWAAIDDDGRAFEKFLDVKEGWNYNLFPSRISGMKQMNDKLSLDLGFTYVNYDAKFRNGEQKADAEEGTLWALDANTRYNAFRKGNFEIQTVQGLGFTKRDPGMDNNMVTLNTGLSFNYWVKEDWGVSLNSQAKWGLTNLMDGGSYLQHGISLFYVAK
jgi:hypothetical protein